MKTNKSAKIIMSTNTHLNFPKIKAGREAFDVSRAVFLTGDITGEMVSALTPRILTLAQDTSRPITLCIDSDGGNVRAAQVILGLLRTPNQSGERCPLHTVVTGRACSAAANLLAAGDYILAYPHSNIHFHGTRFIDEPVLTVEKAREFEEELIGENRSASVRLAASVFPRQLLNYSRLIDTIRSTRKSDAKTLAPFDELYLPGGFDVPAYSLHLNRNLNYPYDDMVYECIQQTHRRATLLKAYRGCKNPEEQLAPIVRAALSQKQKESKTDAVIGKEMLLLNAMIAERIKNEEKWSPSSQDFVRLEQEFQELQAVADGSYQGEVLDQLLLSPKDRKFCARYGMSKDQKQKAKADKIVDQAYVMIEPFWSFTVGLCGLLFRGENPLKPKDAWWLGLIDEVIGTPTTRRELSKQVRESLLNQMPLAEAEKFY